MSRSIGAQSNLVKVIAVDEDKCVNCHACIDACPVKYCNDGSGDSVTIDTNLCIACGACLSACTHDARYFIDDFDQFLNDIKEGENIIAIADTSTVANFPNKYLNLNGWLKSLGISAVFDSSFGAELMIMSYVNHIMSNEPKLVISQNCPAIVSYIEIYKPELLDFLAPVESSILHTIKMVKEYFPKYKDYKVAVLSPCAARKREFEERGLGHYNIGFMSINDYFTRNKVHLTRFPEIDYDNEPPERASLISSPGGLLRTVERWMPDIRGNSRVLEGPRFIYDYFDTLYEQVKNGRTPLLIDCLNCDFGCNQGPLTIAQHQPVDEIEHWVEKRNVELQEHHKNEAGGGTDASRRNIEKILGSYWKEGLYNRDFMNLEDKNYISIPTIEQREKYYKKMFKERPEDIKNCMGCGYKTCEAMVVAINNNLNKIANCTVFLQKKGEQSFRELNKTKRSLEKIIEDLPFGIILINKEDVVKDLNPLAMKVIGCQDKEQIVGQERSKLFDQNDWKSEKQRQRIFINTKDGEKTPILKSVIPVNYRNEEMLLFGFIDITKIVEAEKKGKELQKTLEQKINERTKELEKSLGELKKTQESLKMAKENAEQANKMKSEFLANMSHEIRTPMNAILGFTKVLMEDESSREKLEHLETINNAGENLLNIINEILDFSKIEADKLEITEEPFSLKKLLIHFEKMLTVRANKKGIFFNVSVADNLPDRLIGDRHRINQILINLAGNAIKFTERGGVMVNCRYDKEGHTIIEVQDTGIGIPKEKHRAIFEPFRQADGTTTRKFGGTGLGLAISLKLIKMMDGDLEIISEEGLGTKFNIKLPLKKSGPVKSEMKEAPVEKEVKPEAITNLVDKSIAVILNKEDEKIYQKMMDSTGFQIHYLDNKNNTVEKIPDLNPDLIILDLDIENTNAFNLNQKLKSNLKTAQIPLLATSIKDKSDAGDVLQYGVLDYIQKPVKKEELLKRLYLILKHSGKIKNIFVIDDDENILKLFSNYLKNNHYQDFMFSNAKDALAALDNDVLPDLIILDLLMPELSGFDFLKKLREKYTKKEVPVVVVTGKELTLDDMKLLRDETLTVFKKSDDTFQKFIDYINHIFNRDPFDIETAIIDWSKAFATRTQMAGFFESLSQLLDELEEAVINSQEKLVDKKLQAIEKLMANKSLKYVTKLTGEMIAAGMDKEAFIRAYLELRDLLKMAEQSLDKIDDKSLNFNKSSTNPKREKTGKILVVEDQKPNQKLLEIFLRQINRKCDMAENGKVALGMMRKNQYDIVLLDMHMPVMNGLETITEIRKDENLKMSYVIALTADAMKGDAEKYVEAGCDAYLSKPVNKLALEKKLKVADEMKI